MLKLIPVLILFFQLFFFSCSPVVETSEEFPEGGTFDAQKSIQYLDKLIEHDKGNADALFQRASLELQVSQTLKAKEDVIAALALEPSNPEFVMLKAKIDALIGQSADAINSIENLLKNGNVLKTVEAQLFATNLYLNVNQLNKAEYFLQQAARHAPELPEVLFNRARLYAIRHDTARAISFYKHILFNDSLHSGALTNLAEIYLNRNLTDSSLTLLQKVSNKNQLQYQLLTGRALTLKGFPDSASRYWGQALLLSPRDPLSHYELGKYYYQKKFYQNAASHFAAVSANDRRKFKDFYILFALTSEQLADSAKAVEYYNQAKLLDSTLDLHKIHKLKVRSRHPKIQPVPEQVIEQDKAP